MLSKVDVSIFDANLTPQNAKERGYEYIDDIFYNGSLSSREIVELIKEHGHRMGQPSDRNNFESFVGIYAPIDQKK